MAQKLRWSDVIEHDPPMTDEEETALNAWADEAESVESVEADGELFTRHGKVVPYIGWFWRPVDFTRRIGLGQCPAFIGFMENNKWGYSEWMLTDDQCREIVRRLREMRAAAPNDSEIAYDDLKAIFDKIQSFWDYIQKCEDPLGRGVTLWASEGQE